jgi:hypothetical protein
MEGGMRLPIVTIVILASALAAAEAGDMCPCENDVYVSCPGMRISVCPRETFELIRNGCGGDNDYIEVYIRDCTPAGIPGIPPTDFWMNACQAQYELCLCVQALVADSLTGTNGRTTFSGGFLAGGCVPQGGLWMACQGKTILDDPLCVGPECIDVVIVSPDLNADCQVNLSDLSFFGESYNTSLGDPDFNTCCDYNDDGVCNLSDFSFLGQHYQHGCF